jgi:hypothetical protein
VALLDASGDDTLEAWMNSALYLVNALVLVAVVSFHFLATPPGSRVSVDVRDWVRPPVAQRADMHERQHASALTATAPAPEDMLPTPSHRPERFTF